MILQIFTWLSNALNQNPFIAIFAAFVWGVLSIILSPCHLASIPLIVGFIDGQGKMTTKRAFYLSFLFSFGILVTIAAIGLITGLMGRMLGDIGRWGNFFVAAIFFIVGLYLLDVLKLSFLQKSIQPGVKSKGALAAFVLGLVFGIALGPCTFAYMAPILAVTFNLSASQFLYGILLLVVYGIGHCSVIVFAGTFTEVIQHYLNWNERSKGAVILKRICGVLVILGGFYLIFFDK
jgi:cytochrome c-type biogenesis protein